VSSKKLWATISLKGGGGYEAPTLSCHEPKKEQRKLFLEDLLASTSPEYLESIQEARKDYREGRVKTHKEAFGR
jgi:hypothetical protein